MTTSIVASKRAMPSMLPVRQPATSRAVRGWRAKTRAGAAARLVGGQGEGPAAVPAARSSEAADWAAAARMGW